MEVGLWHKFTRTPGGRLEAAVVRPGDIPIETHSGLYGFGARLRRPHPSWCSHTFAPRAAPTSARAAQAQAE